MHYTLSAITQRFRSLKRSTRLYTVIFAIIGLLAASLPSFPDRPDHRRGNRPAWQDDCRCPGGDH